MISDVDIFNVSVVPLSSLEKCLFRSSGHVLIGLFGFCLVFAI